MKKLVCLFGLLALALCISLPALAQIDLYNNLGSGGSVYQCCSGWTVSGTAGTGGTSFTSANEFTAMASGNISQIDMVSAGCCTLATRSTPLFTPTMPVCLVRSSVCGAI